MSGVFYADLRRALKASQHRLCGTFAKSAIFPTYASFLIKVIYQ
jgi:hypothetical protein